MQALLALILKNVDPELQVSIHVPVLSIRSDRRQETLSMPKHISVKNQNWTIIFGDVFCLSLNSVQPKKKMIVQMLYHQATRDYYQESISQGAEELFVTLIVHCTLVPRIANVFIL